MPIEWSVEVHDTLKSTQDIVKGMGRVGEPEGHVVQALVQNAGYGRHGRTWISEEGNLSMSLLLRPDCHIQEVSQLSLVASLAVANAVRGIIENPDLVRLKWPNDVQIGNDKCAGILLETEMMQSGSVEWLAMGIGMNVKSAPDGLGVAIQNFTVTQIVLNDFRDLVLNKFSGLYELWLRDGLSEIKKEWMALAHGKNAPVEVKIGVQLENGYFHDLDEGGNMVIRDSDYRMRTISAGEVHFPDQFQEKQ